MPCAMAAAAAARLHGAARAAAVSAASAGCRQPRAATVASRVPHGRRLPSPRLGAGGEAGLASLAKAGPRCRRRLAMPAAAAAASSSSSAAASTESRAAVDAMPSPEFARLAAEFSALAASADRYRLLLHYAAEAPPVPTSARGPASRVMGCTAQTYLTAEAVAGNAEPRVRFCVWSDSEISRGLAGLLLRGAAGLSATQLAATEPAALKAFLAALGLGATTLAPSRANGLLNVWEAMRKRARQLLRSGALAPPGAAGVFPSLLISTAGLTAQGPFAEAQAAFLRPAAGTVSDLAALLAAKRCGVVAHFYMDPEVQGVLTAAAASWKHIAISDSLAMADAAVAMARAGCEHVAVLGVDFMSENVRAILDEAGFPHVGVLRCASAPIGCSLAEAAEAEAYTRYLEAAARTPRSLHVIYINTSLRTKATAQRLLPTITCTSSNVVGTVLQAAAQVPDVSIWYGPDSYMGANLAELLGSLAAGPDEAVRAVHPAHDAASVRALLPRLRYFDAGICMVHHLFGAEVTAAVREHYGDAYIAAHFEVPGEMFALAMAARADRDMGCVGSTSNILDFIAAKLQAALAAGYAQRLQFVLGTEAGMLTAIVRRVEDIMKAAGAAAAGIEVEIVFPVSPDAIARAPAAMPAPGAPPASAALAGMAIVPGVAGGEGCSSAGGCASCPYMKMNTLAALQQVVGLIGTPAAATLLPAFAPKTYAAASDGPGITRDGCVSILHMRGYQSSGRLPAALVEDITTRNA